MRFAEALQFALGRPIDWEVLETCCGNTTEIRVRPHHKAQHNARIAPPISWDVCSYFSEFWELFGKYLTFIWPHAEDEWHPVTRRLFTLQHAMVTLWPISMLVVGVEVEGILADYYSTLVTPTEQMKQSVDEVTRLVDVYIRGGGTGIDSNSLARIQSALGRLKDTTSARNKLKELASQSVIRSVDVEAWEFVRNKTAHAVASETGITQDNSLRQDRVLVLFYHLVFHLIGYHGKYTDYGELGCPIKSYPS